MQSVLCVTMYLFWLVFAYSSVLTFPFLGTCLSPPKNLPRESRKPVSLYLLWAPWPYLERSEVLAEAIGFDPWRDSFWEAIKSVSGEVDTLSSGMVWSSSDSEGRSLKVLSSLPGASRENRRTKCGRGSVALACFQLSWGSSVLVESVTAVPLDEVPLFWFTSAANNKREMWMQGCEKKTMIPSSH